MSNDNKPAAAQEAVAYIVTPFRTAHDGSYENGPDELCFAEDASEYAKQTGLPLYAAPVAAAPVDLTNWAAHYSINPAAVEALQSMLTSPPAAPGIDPAALRAAPEAVALRTAMTTLEQIASAPDDQGAKFNAMGALRFLQTQPVELRAAPEGFVLVPVEPTREMLDMVCTADGFEPWTDKTMGDVYRTMLAARPQGVK